MANSANRITQWDSGASFTGSYRSGFPLPTTQPFTDAQLDLWKSRGITGYALQTAHLYGLGGGFNKFTGNPSEVGAGQEWDVQRSIRDSNFVARCAARGIKVWIVVWAANYNGPYFWRPWFDDAGWAEVIENIRRCAAMCQLYGIAGIFWDLEDYPYGGTSIRPSWAVTSQTTGNDAQTRAKVRQRGAEIAAAVCGAFPTIEMAAYFLRLPMGWQAYASAQAPGTDANYTNQYKSWVAHDLLSGFFSTRQLQTFRHIDSMAYKSVDIYQASLATAYKLNHGPMRAFLSQYPGFDWDWAASRFQSGAFTWIDPGQTPYEALRPVAYVADQLDQASRWSTGGEFHNYGHHFPGDATFQYTNYLPGLAVAATARTIDTQSPTMSVLSSQTVGSNQVISGSANDDMAVFRVGWRNNRTGATGEAALTFVDLSGRPANPVAYGQLPLGFANIASYATWRMDWSCTVPLQLSNDPITLTVEDIHGLTATVNVTGGDPINPPTTLPVVTANAAGGVSQTAATLSGTVNPKGLATTARFEYGLTTSYGTLAPLVDMGSGATPGPISQVLNGLTGGALYHFRLTATNAAGTSTTTDGTFATASNAAPAVLADNAAAIGDTTVTFTGTVNPNSLATTARFEYGPTAAYGTQTPVVAVGAGAIDVAMSENVVGLAAGTLYHHRLTATNSAGTNVTADRTFTTAAGASPPPSGDQGGALAAAILNLTGLRSYWRLGELTGAVLDSKGINTGTVTGGVTRGVAGIIGAGGNAAILLDGISGRIDVPHNASLNLGDGPYSLLAYFKRSAIGTTDAIFDKGPSGYHFYIDTDNKLKAGKSDFAWGVESTVTVTDTTGYHMAVITYDGAAWKAYLDGADVTGPQSDLVIADVATPLRIGGDTTAHFFNGTVDELAIAATVISPAQALDLWTLASSAPAQTGTLEQLLETDLLHAVTVIGGAGETESGGEPFYMRDDLDSTLRGGAYLRGPGTVVVGDTTIEIGQLTETETLFSPVASKTRAVGLLAEADTLLSLTSGQLRVLGLLAETDVLLTPDKGRVVGQLVETDTLFSLSIVLGITSRRKPLDETDDSIAVIEEHVHRAEIFPRQRTAVLTAHSLRGD